MFNLLVTFFMLLVIFQGMRARAWRDRALRLFWAVFILGFATELAAMWMARVYGHNIGLINLYLMPEFMLLSAYAVMRWQRPRWWIWGLLAATHTLIAITDLYFMKAPWLTLSVKAFVFGSMVLPTLHFWLLWREVDRSEAPVWHSSHFWASASIVLFFGTMAPAVALLHYLVDTDSPLAPRIGSVMPVMALVRFILAFIAFTVHPIVSFTASHERS